MNVKRPSFLILGVIILGIISQSWGNRYIDKIIILSIGFFLYTLYLLIQKLNIKTYIILLLIFILSAYRFTSLNSFNNQINKNIDSFNNKSQQVTATIEKFGKSKNSNYIILKEVYASNKYLYKSICYYKNEYTLKIGNKILINGYINKYDLPMNEGEFNSLNYYRSINISNMIYANDIQIIDNKYDILLQKIYEIKLLFKNQIYNIFNNRSAGLFTAMLLGDKTGIEIDQKKLFNENGIAHIIAISGLHLSILGLALYELLRKKFSVKFSAIVVSLFILFYAIFIDASIVTLRAILMLYIRFVSLAIRRTYDSNNTLFIIAILSLLYNPYFLYNQGFQFSYLAVFALNYQFRFYKFDKLRFIDKIKKKYNIKIRKYYVIPQVIILNLFIMPITIYNYFDYPTYSIILNLVVIPLMPIVLVIGIFSVLLSFINIYIGIFFAGAVHYIFVFYETMCNLIEKLPYSKINFGRQNTFNIIIHYIVIFILHYILAEYIYYKKNKKIYILELYYANKKRIMKNYNYIKNKFNNIIIIFIEKLHILIFSKIIYISLLFIFVISIFINIILIKKSHIYDMRITSLYIGQGDSFIIQNNNKFYTIDGGSSSNLRSGEYILSPHLKSRAINNIDISFISHADSDHCNAIIYLLENEYDISINNIVLPIQAKTNNKYDSIKKAANERRVKIYYMKALEEISIDSGIKFLCINPNENDELAINDINEQSLVIKFIYKNKSILYTGDISKNIELKLINNKKINSLLQSDVLKICHHGSKNSNDIRFIKSVNPKIAIISYGINNRYGHPSKNTIDNLNKNNIDIYETAKEGQIDLYFNDNILINSFKNYKQKTY